MQAEKKIYRLADDGSLTPSGEPYEIVSFLHNSSRFASLDTRQAFMEGFALRYRIDTGNSVRVDSSYNFVADLVKFGFLTEVAT